MRTCTEEELSSFNGLNGRPAYIAFEGRVYDVSNSWHWKGGAHQVMHKAGEDLTGALKNAPHGEDLLMRVPVVGTLVK